MPLSPARNIRLLLSGGLTVLLPAFVIGLPACGAEESSRLKLGVVQMATAKTMAENRDRIVKSIVEVAAHRARVAVLPENVLTGEGENDPATVEAGVEAIRQAARKSAVYVLFGGRSWFPPQKRLTHWLYVIGPDGRDLLRYDKLTDQPQAAMPGVFSVDGIPCGAILCADRWLRGVQEMPVQNGAKVMFELSCNFANEWIAPFGWYWNVPQALRNSAWVVFANTGNTVPGVPDSGVASDLRHGHSAVIAPDGRIVASSPNDAATILYADIDAGEATRAEARARASHPALRGFWEAGAKLHRGENVEARALAPWTYEKATVTLAASTVTRDVEAMTAKVREASAQDADLIVFPACALPEFELWTMQAAAKDNRITVVLGSEHPGTNRLYESAFVVGPDGKILTRYDQLSATTARARRFAPGDTLSTMSFRVKGVPAIVTVGRDALWTELSELAAVAGARVHVHLENDSDKTEDAAPRRLQIWANLASYQTFSATVNTTGAAIWDDLNAMEDRHSGGPVLPVRGGTEVVSPFSADLVTHAEGDRALILATREIAGPNQHYSRILAHRNPQMAPWFRIGAALFASDSETKPGVAGTRPYERGKFKGRIAISTDGNFNDPDDWAASPVALAILAEAGLKERLVHFDYNCLLTGTDAQWEKKHADGVLGAARHYGYDAARFFDCRKDLAAAQASLVQAINASSAADPLYFIIGGPMEVPVRAIEKSYPVKRAFVYCISHSRWNDGYDTKDKFTFTKRGVIEQDVHWTQIPDQNGLLSFGRYGQPAKPEEFKPYFWMRDSQDAKVRFLWERMVVSTRPDPSDAGMAWFLATGDEQCDPAKLKRLLEDHQMPAVTAARSQVRLEAENFRFLDGCKVEAGNDRNASHRLSVRSADGVDVARLRTRIDEPFTSASGHYDVEVRCFDGKALRTGFSLLLNGQPCGAGWESTGTGKGWITHTLPSVTIKTGDELRIDLSGKEARVDFVQLNFRETGAAGK